MPIFDEWGVYTWPSGSKIDSNQSMEKNDNNDHGSSDRPTFIENCVMQLQLECRSGDYSWLTDIPQGDSKNTGVHAYIHHWSVPTYEDK